MASLLDATLESPEATRRFKAESRGGGVHITTRRGCISVVPDHARQRVLLTTLEDETRDFEYKYDPVNRSWVPAEGGGSGEELRVRVAHDLDRALKHRPRRHLRNLPLARHAS
jgi:hypothetical protein